MCLKNSRSPTSKIVVLGCPQLGLVWRDKSWMCPTAVVTEGAEVKGMAVNLAVESAPMTPSLIGS